MKKNRYSWRLNNSSKTFLNQWESKGIRNLRNLSNSSSTLLYKILSSTASKFTFQWSVATSLHPPLPLPKCEKLIVTNLYGLKNLCKFIRETFWESLTAETYTN